MQLRRPDHDECVRSIAGVNQGQLGQGADDPAEHGRANSPLGEADLPQVVRPCLVVVPYPLERVLLPRLGNASSWNRPSRAVDDLELPLGHDDTRATPGTCQDERSD